MIRSLLAASLLALLLAALPDAANAQETEAPHDAGIPSEAPTGELAPSPDDGQVAAPEEPAATDTEASPSAEDEAAEAAREQLRAARVGELAARTRASIQSARPLLRASGDVTRIQRSLPDVEREVTRLAHPSRLARIPRLSQRELADRRGQWRRHANRLERWQRSISERAAEIEEARTALVELKRTWQELRDLSERAGRPEPRHARVIEGLETTRRALAEIESNRDELSALADRISDVQIVVEDVTDQLRDAASLYRERLAIRDAPPLYEGLGGSAEGTTAPEALADRADVAPELLAELTVPALSLVAALLLLIAVLRALDRSRASPDGARASLGPLATEVLRVPIAASALLALLGASFLVEQAPVVVYDAIFFATLLPLWRAVPPLTAPALRPAVQGTIVFVALDRVQSMLLEGSGVLRVVLILEAVLTLAGLALWLSGRGREAPLWSRALAALVVALFGTALIANATGYLFLATVLTRGVGFSAYTGVSLAGAVVVVEAVIDLVIASALGRTLRMFRDHAALVHQRTLRLLGALALASWLVATLEGFGVWGPLSATLEDILGDEHEIGSLELTLGAVLGAIAILVATHATLRLVRFTLELDVLPRLALEPGVDGAISGLTSYLVGGTGLLLALAYLGIDASQIALVAGALGVGIGFGLQGIVANFIAGIVLMIERPVRLGDFIEVGSLVGSVDRIGLRSSTVKALDGAEVIVPNESLISREVVNWTLSDRKRRVEVKVGVAYGTDPKRVVALLKRVAIEHRDPSVGVDPEVLFDAFGESSLDFTLQFWAKTFADSIKLKSEVGIAVHEALAAEGIEIPFPQRDLHIKSVAAEVSAASLTGRDRSGSGSGSPSGTPDRAPGG